MKKSYVIAILLCFIIPQYMYAQTLSESIVHSLPVGWEPDNLPVLYSTETLYEYINGGAELYISYGMESVLSQRIKHKTYGEIRIEVFDMAHSYNAFGVFTHSRTKDEKKYGQGSQYFTGAQIFWKDKYFVSVIADDENDEIIKAIAEISESIDSQIQSYGEIPDIITSLPVTNQIIEGYIFFHHYIWLNAYYFLSNENILLIDDKCEAIVSKYGTEKEKYYLLLIKYEDGKTSSSAFEAFNNHFLDGKGKSLKIEDGTWVYGKRVENYLIGIFNVPSKILAESLLSETEKNLNR